MRAGRLGVLSARGLHHCVSTFSCLRIDCRLNGVGAYILDYNSNYVIGIEWALCGASGKRSWWC
jgi:hypothetical protein